MDVCVVLYNDVQFDELYMVIKKKSFGATNQLEIKFNGSSFKVCTREEGSKFK